jgi:fucose permease
VVLNWLSAQKFLLINVLLAIVGLAGLVFTHTWAVALVSIFVTGIGCANIFPMIFAITINALPQRANEVAGLMVTAIVGGAVIPPLTGLAADRSGSVALAFFVPMACIAYLLVAALFALRASPQPDSPA